MRTALLVPILLGLVLTGCERILGDPDENVSPVSEEVVERVVGEVLLRMRAVQEEIGPRFPTAVPELKAAAAQREGFDDWAHFQKRVRKLDPGLDLEISRRLTDRMKELLEANED